MIEWFRQLGRASRDAEATGITFGQQPLIAAKLRYYADCEFAGRYDQA